MFSLSLLTSRLSLLNWLGRLDSNQRNADSKDRCLTAWRRPTESGWSFLLLASSASSFSSVTYLSTLPHFTRRFLARTKKSCAIWLVFFAPGGVSFPVQLGHVLEYAPSLHSSLPCQNQKILRQRVFLLFLVASSCGDLVGRALVCASLPSHF